MSETLETFPCGYCQAKFKDEAKMIQHIETRHLESDKESREDFNSIIDHFECHPCQIQFENETLLATHIQSVHEEESDEKSDKKSRPRSFPCQNCEKSFFTSSDLWSHQRIHSGSKYTCHQCGKKLASSGSLHNHQKSVHEEEKHFECHVCFKRFALKQKLVNHVKRDHEGRKPFQCDKCDQGFVHKQSYEAHQRKHNGTVLNCELCSKPFHDAGYLKKHMRWHQKMQDLRKYKE